MISLLELFCRVDDFCQMYELTIENHLIGKGKKPGPKPRMHLSEIMTIIITFHQSGYRNFKKYYSHMIRDILKKEFPTAVSYNRFVELMPTVLIPLCIYLHLLMGKCTGISFIDSTSLVVSHNKRISQHKVFKDVAERGKTSMGWFYGFKLHLIINDCGEILSFCLTPGNVDDRKPVPKLTKSLFGKLFGDKGYIKQTLFEELFEKGLSLFTPIRKNMKNKLVVVMDKLLQRKRSIIETVNDQLKNISQIEHSRHRSIDNFVVNLIAGLIAYSHQEKKPSLNLDINDKDKSSLSLLI